MTHPQLDTARVAVIGGGPAGLMAAETLANAGFSVDLYDALPSVGRKLLIAGKGGLNITHSEAADAFRRRYGKREGELTPMLDAFGPGEVREWMHGLGIDSFVGSSGRVFPVDLKAAPLLRAWLRRLRGSGVRLHMRHRCVGIDSVAAPDDGSGSRVRVHLATADGERQVDAAAVVLALGGGSWAKLGADGRWVDWLRAAGVPVAPLQPANCGFEVDWSEFFSSRFAGEPVKNVAARIAGNEHAAQWQRGEFVVTANGVEGGLIYAFSAALRDAITATGSATLSVDLLPERSSAQVCAEIAHPRGRRSLGSHLASRLGLRGVKSALVHEFADPAAFADPALLAAAIKSLPLLLTAPRPLDEAISSAGGVMFEAIDEKLMLRPLPGVFCAGEMLDWEAPTGGYLLTACLASGRAAAVGASEWLRQGSRR